MNLYDVVQFEYLVVCINLFVRLYNFVLLCVLQIDYNSRVEFFNIIQKWFIDDKVMLYNFKEKYLKFYVYICICIMGFILGLDV